MNAFSPTTEDFIAQAGEVEQRDNVLALASLCDQYGIDFAKEVPAMGNGWYSVPIRLPLIFTDKQKFDLVADFRKLGFEAHHITFGNLFYTKA